MPDYFVGDIHYTLDRLCRFHEYLLSHVGQNIQRNGHDGYSCLRHFSQQERMIRMEAHCFTRLEIFSSE